LITFIDSRISDTWMRDLYEAVKILCQSIEGLASSLGFLRIPTVF